MWTFIYVIAVIWIYRSRLLYLIQGTLYLACICGVFFSRIYVADSHRNYVFMYFGKRSVTTGVVDERTTERVTAGVLIWCVRALRIKKVIPFS